MKIDTKELMNKLVSEKDIKTFLEKYEEELYKISLTDLLNSYLAKKDIAVGDVARRSGQGDYAYKVFIGTRKPSRDVLISIGIGMHLSLDEMQMLLRVSKFASLDPRDRRDSIILYALNSDFMIEKINALLEEMGENKL